MSPPRALGIYRVVFCALIVIASAQTLIAEPAHHVIALATAEIIGALLLVWPRTQRPGAVLLLLVFAMAQVMAASEGEYPTRFLQYAASTLLIVGLSRALPRSACRGEGARGTDP
jgi:uncharacterized membrane protein YphA (DoxX/SURF4 family)